MRSSEWKNHDDDDEKPKMEKTTRSNLRSEILRIEMRF